LRINKQVRHSVNHKFFSEDNENSFYWAGFLAADGNVRKRRGSCREISLALSIKDKNHIEKFINAIESTAHMGIYLVKNSKRNSKWNDTKKAEVKITSEQMFNDLARFNVVLRKSLIYIFPEWLIEHKLVNHYMRGYFDGDGSFYFSQSPNKQEYFNLRGTVNFLEVYCSILERECSLKERTTSIRVNNGIGALEYGGNLILPKIKMYLANGATVYLDRKWSEFVNNTSADSA